MGAHVSTPAVGDAPPVPAVFATADVRYAHDLHAHPEHQALLLERGEVEIALRGGRHRIAAGDVALVEAWEPHAVRTLGDAGAVVLQVPPDCWREAVDAVGATLPREAPVFPLAVQRDADLASALGALRPLGASRERCASSRLRDDATLLAALTGLARASFPLRARLAAPQPARGIARVAVRRAVDHLHAHLARRVSLDDLAAAACLSKYHLVRTFRATVGIAPHAYLTRLRLAEARRLLLTGMSAGDAAHLVGFSDQSHFTQTFRRWCGVSPGRFAAAARRARGAGRRGETATFR